MREKESVDSQRANAVLTPEEVALFLRKSTSWVYKHWRELGGLIRVVIDTLQL